MYTYYVDTFMSQEWRKEQFMKKLFVCLLRVCSEIPCMTNDIVLQVNEKDF